MPSLRHVKDILYLRYGFPIFVGHFAIFRLQPWAQEDFSGQLFIFLTQILTNICTCQTSKMELFEKIMAESF